MNALACRVCGGPSNLLFHQLLLGQQVAYFDCPRCGYVQTQEPVWLPRAYAHAINASDTGIMARNYQNVGRVIMTLLALRKLKGKIVDHAGGFGILVRLLRDAGVDAYWSDKYCENLLARGFEAARDTAFDLLTAFEVLEHLPDPVADLREMLTCAPHVLVTTELITTPGPPAKGWPYFGLDHGQHIGFFRTATLQAMAAMAGCHCHTDGRFVHLFSRYPIPTTWPLLLPASRFWRVPSHLLLESRTMSDYDLMRGASN